MALAYRLLGAEKKGILYEPRARVLRRHPMTLDQYLDREELLGIMAPVLARQCAAAFDLLHGTRDVEALTRIFRDWVKMDGAMHRWSSADAGVDDRAGGIAGHRPKRGSAC